MHTPSQACVRSEANFLLMSANLFCHQVDIANSNPLNSSPFFEMFHFGAGAHSVNASKPIGLFEIFK